MTEGTSLNSILSDEPVADVVETTPEPVAEPEATGRPRDENGKFVSTKGVEEPAEPQGEADTVPPTDKLPKEDYKAIREEREKRQNLERELEALRNQINQLQTPQEPPAPPPSLWEDEQAWQVHLQQQVLAQADTLSRINASEMAARAQHNDFDEMYGLFNQMAQTNPAIVQQAMSDPHPWNAAYKIAKNYKSMQELAAVDVSDLREKLKAELLEELQQGQTPLRPPAVPASLTGERSVAPRTGPAWSGPRPLGDILR